MSFMVVLGFTTEMGVCDVICFRAAIKSFRKLNDVSMLI